MHAPPLSIIIPVLNEANGISACLQALQPLAQRGVHIIVADGGSTDGTAQLAATELKNFPHALVIHASRGRAQQMNAGAAQAGGGVLLFLHADTLLPPAADQCIAQALASRARAWGRFDVRIDGSSPMLKIVAVLMNLRSRWSGMATGDQAIFMTRAAFDAAGGFPVQPLMEDIEISKRLGKLSRPACLHEKVTTSGRRWETRGVWKTIFLMWRLRFAYGCGAAPERLALLYREVR